MIQIIDKPASVIFYFPIATDGSYMKSKYSMQNFLCVSALVCQLVLSSDVDPDQLAMYPNCGWVKGKSKTWVQ